MKTMFAFLFGGFGNGAIVLHLGVAKRFRKRGGFIHVRYNESPSWNRVEYSAEAEN